MGYVCTVLFEKPRFREMQENVRNGDCQSREQQNIQQLYWDGDVVREHRKMSDNIWKVYRKV